MISLRRNFHDFFEYLKYSKVKNVYVDTYKPSCRPLWKVLNFKLSAVIIHRTRDKGLKRKESGEKTFVKWVQDAAEYFFICFIYGGFFRIYSNRGFYPLVSGCFCAWIFCFHEFGSYCLRVYLLKHCHEIILWL